MLLTLPQNATASVDAQGEVIDNGVGVTSGEGTNAVASTDAVPTGFTEELVTSAGTNATSVALTPDGRLLIATEDGQVRVFANGALVTAPAVDLNVPPIICNDGERGLESVTVDPDFANNQRVYIYHTYNNAGTCINRVVRYTLTAGNVMTTPVVILNNLASPCTNHNGGDLNFGADGMLYVSVGDGGCNVAGVTSNDARYLSLLNGKILRINTDGSIPSTNPYASTAGAVQCGLTTANPSGGTCKEIFAFGFRNPFRTAFKTGTNQLYVNDVGQNTWEEIDDVTAGSAGAANDYGWYCREGKHAYETSNAACNPAPANMIDPLFDYNHSFRCAITGGAFAVSNGVWPAPYDGAYFFADYCSGSIFRLVPGAPFRGFRGLLFFLQTNNLEFSSAVNSSSCRVILSIISHIRHFRFAFAITFGLQSVLTNSFAY